jgi:uncharacterized protein (TIGR03437 family)
VKLFLLVIAASALLSAASSPIGTLAKLPNSEVNAVKSDAAGNIYVAGSEGTPTTAHAFVAKLDRAGNVLYSTSLAGTNNDSAVAIDVDSAGAAYVLGQTLSSDFPVTPGALQSTLQAASGQGFVAKVDPTGKVVYATYIGGSSEIFPGSYGLAVDSAGDAIVSGQSIGGVFPSTPGAPITSTDTNAFFVMKINPNGGELLAAVRGVGGRLALDAQGSVYIAGIKLNTPTSIPITPGAFQTTFRLQACGGDAQLELACSYQYVTKLNASLTQIVYSTYLTGSYGASPAAISVDAQGNAFVAGTTNSPDYPTTSNAFEPSYIAGAPAPPQTCLFFCIFPPPASGYLTQLNATGTDLLYSTFFSGTQTDTITFATFAPNGIYISGSASSPDLPGMEGFPAQCLPQTYAARMSTDATETGAARPAPGQILGYDAAADLLIAWTGSDLVTFNLSAPPPPIGCVLDAVDLKPVSSIAPGELLTIFGQHLAGSPITQAPGQFATSLDSISVAVNGILSPLLYAGPQQINFQAPFEIAGSSQANILLANTQLNLSDSRTLDVVASNPVAVLDSTTSLSSLANCHLSGIVYNGGPAPLAFNADGTRNSCSNPASPGSVVQILLAGLGVTSPAQATGAVTPNPGPALNLPVTIAGGSLPTVVSASAVPGLISGVWQVEIRLPTGETGALGLSLSVAGVPVRDADLTVWVQ